jgi:hypothetical protein
MPYELKKVKKDKFKVCKKDDKKVCFSKKALSKKTALKQKFAIESSERRRFGMGTRSSKRIRNWATLYDQYLRIIKADTDLDDDEVDDKETFRINYAEIYESDDSLTENEILAKVVNINVNRNTINTDDESEEKVKARSRSASRTSELTMNTEDQNAEVYNNYESQIDTYNNQNDEEFDTLEFDDFIKKYEEKMEEDDDYEPDTIIEMIIEDQVKEKYGETTETEKDDMAWKFKIATAFKDPNDITSDFKGEQIFDSNYVVDRKTNGQNINYKSLEKLYDYISGKCRENMAKGGYYGWFVDTTDADDIREKNYEELSALTAICQKHIAPRDYNDNWCKDKCSGHVWHFDLFNHNYFGCVFRLQDDGIYLSSGCWVAPYTDNIYIELLCGLGGGKYIMEAFKRLYKQNSEDFFFKKNKNRKFEYLDLNSVPSYVTVEFYYKQGLIEDSHVPNDVIDLFKEEIFDQIEQHNFVSVEEYCEKYLPYFESGICDPSDTYLDEIYDVCATGGHKYLYPKYNVSSELGTFSKDINGTTLISYNYLKGFKDFCKDAIANPEQYQQYSRPAITTRNIKERLENLPAKAREIRTGKLRTKRMLRNPDLPRQNLINQRNVNTQLRNVLTELEESGLPADENAQSVDVLANKPRFAEQGKDLTTRQKQTAINRLKGNEPRTAYKRMKQLREFGMPSVRNVAVDPFETKKQMVRTQVRIPRSHPAKYRTVVSEPPVKSGFTMDDTLITRGDPTGSGVKGTKFYEELKGYGIDPVKYLAYMKKQAKKAGYDYKQLTLDNDDKHKLRISTEDGIKHFGAVGYKDNFIYQHLEKTKQVPKGTAKQMRDRFQKSHGAITTKRKLGRNSANELSLKILW